MIISKNKLKDLIIERVLLTEKNYSIDEDVDLIYNKYFKDDCETINNGGTLTSDMFKISRFTTDELVSEECIKANKINKCLIFTNRGRNYYNPFENIISVSVDEDVLDVLDQGDGTLKNGLMFIDSKYHNTFIKEFTEERIKGSIEHELIHWLDDTLNKNHLKNKFNKSNELGYRYFHKNKNINSHYMEINAQIGNIKQVKRKYANLWDDLSFQDLIDKTPTLTNVYRSLKGDELTKWVRDLKTRMHREDLLGKKMI